MADSAPKSSGRKRLRSLRVAWRDHVQARWSTQRWTVIGFPSGAAAGLGYVGCARYFADLGESRSPSDLFYLILQLFTLESDSVLGPKGRVPELARLLAPAAAAYTAVQALSVFLLEQHQSLQLLPNHPHFVICGPGEDGAAGGYPRRFVPATGAAADRAIAVRNGRNPGGHGGPGHRWGCAPVPRDRQRRWIPDAHALGDTGAGARMLGQCLQLP